MATGDIRICIEQARAFYRTAELLYDRDDDLGLSEMLYPFVVNAAFSCELSLKAISMISKDDHEFEWTHNLLSLFNSLGRDDREAIATTAEGKFDLSLDELLEENSEAFPDWRYAFQQTVVTHPTELLLFAEILKNYAESCTLS